MNTKVILSISALVICVGLPSAYVATQQPRFDFDPKCKVHFALLKGGYRSWSINWCGGLQLNPEGWRHLYHFPKFNHFDLRGGAS